MKVRRPFLSNLAIDFSTPIACYQDSIGTKMCMPIYGILFGGDIFQFFIFDGSTKPYKFSMGVVPGTQNHVDSKFKGLPL